MQARRTIIILFKIVFLVVVFFALLWEMQYLINTIIKGEKVTELVSAVTIVLVIFALLVAVDFIGRRWINPGLPLNTFVVIVCLIGVTLRVVFCLYCGTTQISDFAEPLKFYDQKITQEGQYESHVLIFSDYDRYQREYSFYPAWGSYMLISHVLFSIFGNSNFVMQMDTVAFNFMMDFVERITAKHRLKETQAYFLDNKERIKKNLSILYDEKSKQVYIDYIKYRGTLKWKYLHDIDRDVYFDPEIIKFNDNEVFIDGAN